MALGAQLQGGRMQSDEVLILGSSSPAGSHLAAALNRRSIRHRAVLQSSKNRDKSFVVAADEPSEVTLTDVDALTFALRGYRIVYDCLTAASEDPLQYRAGARNLAIAIAKTSVKVIHVTNYWSYFPLAYLPLDEEHPREGGEDWARYRREAEDVLLAAGSAIVHLPDLYGPFVRGGLIQRAIEDAYTTRQIRWIGATNVDREYAFAPDAMEAVVRLSYCSEAMGQRWMVGGNGSFSAERLAEIASKKLDAKVSLSTVGPFALKLRSFFDEKARAWRQMPDPSQPIGFNCDKIKGMIGLVPTTGVEQGIARTLEWMDRRRSVK
ncbi:MAG: NAD-dependent epimerase/dehydratase family protein [Bryobacterales bacterium]